MPKKLNLNITYDQLYDLYINKNLSDAESAVALNISAKMFRKLRLEAGINKPKDLAYQKRQQTKLDRYGTTDMIHSNKAKATMAEKYGDENYNNRDKMKQTKLEHFGNENYVNSDLAKQTKLEKYGSETYNNSDKMMQTKLDRYGDENYNNPEKVKQTKLERYGDENYCNIDKIKTTKLERYGDENYQNMEKVKQTKLERYGYSSWNMEKVKQTKLEKYGSETYNNSEKRMQTNLEKYGCSGWNMEKVKQTNNEKYGVDWYCLMPECINKSNGANSGPNLEFEKLLIDNNISYDREFVLNNFKYDFKVGNNLIEINPTYTHNSTYGYRGQQPLDSKYHLNKSAVANENGYRCIHIWDWDMTADIINLLKGRDTIYARKCKVAEVAPADASTFVNDNHIQGWVKADVLLGLYYNNNLVAVMTFGKPRYNKNYQWEIIRYCSNCNIVGGAEKLWKHFIKTYKPESVISYCDKSKFSGDTYLKLGMTLKNRIQPSKHWYNIKTGRHITDNLLRQQGFDRLFNTNYGKGTSNEQLMINEGFVEVYDCGQATYTWSV